MAELSDFLPKSAGSGYIADYYSGGTVTSTTTVVTSDNASIVNVTGKGIVCVVITNSTTTLTLTIDGVTFTGDRETLSRMVGQGGQDSFNTGRVSINLGFRDSVVLGASGLTSGSVSATVTV